MVAGSKVSGFVWADVKKEVSGRSLEVGMFGEERCKVKYETGSGKDRRTRYAHASRPLIQVAIPVKKEEMLVHGKVPPGKYELPFEIELPDSLPSTMAAHAFGGDCSIRYYIKVMLKGSGWFSDYKTRRDVIVVSKPLPKDPVPCIKEPVSEHVRFCCCFDQGTISFGSKVDDTVLGRGDQVRIAMSCVNDTKAAISSIKATLTERVTWTAHSRRNHTTRKLCEVDFGKISGMDKKTKSELLAKKSAVNYTMENHEVIFEDIRSGSHVGMIKNPEQANDTYFGKVITCQHFIEIEVNTSGCVSNIKTVIPVQSGTPSNITSTPTPASTPEPDEEVVVMPAGFSDDATVLSPVFVPENAAAVGGVEVDTGEDSTDPFSTPFTTNDLKIPSLANLMQELNDSVKDLDFVEDKIHDPDWRPIFVNLKPSEYGEIIKKVDLDFDQPKVAEAMAPIIADGAFTCNFLIAAVRSASNWNRINMVEKLLPYCHDLSSQEHAVMAELTDWEKTVTAQAFKNAKQQ